MQTALLSMFQMPEVEFRPRLGRSVTVDQAANLLGVCRRTVYYRIREGRLSTIRTIGGSQRVLLESLQTLRGSNLKRQPSTTTLIAPSTRNSFSSAESLT